MIKEEYINKIPEDTADNNKAVNAGFDDKVNNKEETINDDKFEETSNKIKENKKASIMTKTTDSSKVLVPKVPKVPIILKTNLKRKLPEVNYTKDCENSKNVGNTVDG